MIIPFFILTTAVRYSFRLIDISVESVGIIVVLKVCVASLRVKVVHSGDTVTVYYMFRS